MSVGVTQLSLTASQFGMDGVARFAWPSSRTPEDQGDPMSHADFLRARILDLDMQLLMHFGDMGSLSVLHDDLLRPLAHLLAEREETCCRLGELALRNPTLVARSASDARPASTDVHVPVGPTPSTIVSLAHVAVLLEPVALAPPLEDPASRSLGHERHGPVASVPSPPAKAAGVSAAALEALRRKYAARGQGNASGIRASRGEERGAVKQLLDGLGRLPNVATAADARDEMEHLRRLVLEDARDLWGRVPPEWLLSYLELIVARCRAAQEHHDGPTNGRRIHEALRNYLQTERIGFVYGLAFAHTPKTGSWQGDAQALHENLAPSPTSPTSPPSGKARPSAAGKDISDATFDLPADTDRDDSDTAFDNWKHAGRFKGAAVLMFGGNRRARSEAELQRALRLGSLKWQDNGKPRQLDSVVKRIAGGAYGAVLINQFASHPETERLIEACKRTDVLCVTLRNGYGAQAARSAVDRALG